jgi:hypothetical protein
MPDFRMLQKLRLLDFSILRINKATVAEEMNFMAASG